MVAPMLLTKLYVMLVNSYRGLINYRASLPLQPVLLVWPMKRIFYLLAYTSTVATGKENTSV